MRAWARGHILYDSFAEFSGYPELRVYLIRACLQLIGGGWKEVADSTNTFIFRHDLQDRMGRSAVAIPDYMYIYIFSQIYLSEYKYIFFWSVLLFCVPNIRLRHYVQLLSAAN